MEEKALKAKTDELGQKMFDMQELENRFQLEHEAEYKAIADLKEEIKKEVINLGRTMETLKLKVEFRRGSIRWDTKFLEGYVLNHPELCKYRLEGKPTVAFKLKDEIPFETE
jgi:hypothetical protein